MANRRSLTSQLYRAARISNSFRATPRSPGAYGKRQVRRRAYRTSGWNHAFHSQGVRTFEMTPR
jgi:hypothetical protein